MIRRAEVPARIVSHEVRQVAGQRVGYVQVLEFSRGVGQAVRMAMTDFRASGVSEVVLDLRHNGGGLVDDAVALTAVFTPSGTPVFVESGQHVEKTVCRTHTAPADLAVPLVVLVDRDTASAAEIVTGAHQETQALNPTQCGSLHGLSAESQRSLRARAGPVACGPSRGRRGWGRR